MGKDDSSHSLEEREKDQWPSFQEEDDTKNFLPSPRRNVEDFTIYEEGIAVEAKLDGIFVVMYITAQQSSNHSIIKSRSPPTVNQITEALENLARI